MDKIMYDEEIEEVIELCSKKYRKSVDDRKSGFNQNGRRFEITREQFLEQSLQKSSIISSAVDTTKEVTRTSTVNEQISSVKEQEEQNRDLADLNNSIDSEYQEY